MDNAAVHNTNDVNKGAGATAASKHKRRRNKKKKPQQPQQQQQQENLEGTQPGAEAQMTKSASPIEPPPQVAVEPKRSDPGVGVALVGRKDESAPVASKAPLSKEQHCVPGSPPCGEPSVEAKTPSSLGIEGTKKSNEGDANEGKSDEIAAPRVASMPPKNSKPREEADGDAPKGSEGGEQKSKAQLRAERREKQEAQRAAKAEKLAAAGKAPQQKQQQKTPKEPKEQKAPKEKAPREERKGDSTAKAEAKKGEPPKDVDIRRDSVPALRVMDDVRHDDPQLVRKRQKKMEKQKICPRVEIRKKVDLFSHLPQYQIGRGLLIDDWQGGTDAVNASVYREGIQVAHGKLMGAHHRCMALIESAMRIILCYKFADREFGRDFENKLSPNITFLSQCRPMTAGMRGFIKHFKAFVVSIGRNDKLEDDDRKIELLYVSYGFYKDKLLLARKTISERAVANINDGDCILVYAFSSLVELVLKYAWAEKGRQFRVIVADSEPLWEGRKMLQFLEKEGIPCEYASLSGVPSVMARVTRVFLGAQALLNNGSVLSRAGTGLVATMAHQFRCAVIVCCESYKFWERVQLDSFVYNELGDPSALVDNDSMRQLWDDPKSGLHYLNPIYDITPSDLVDMVITERSIMPATSVPVVLRSKSAAF